MDGHGNRCWDVDGIGYRDRDENEDGDGDKDGAGDRIWMGTGTGCARPHPVLGREVVQGLLPVITSMCLGRASGCRVHPFPQLGHKNNPEPFPGRHFGQKHMC